MNVKRTVVLTLVVLSVVAFSVAPLSADEAKEQKAVTAAQEWLSLVDAGKYAESWDEAAAFFRGAVLKGTWTQQLTAARKPLGRMLSRTVASKTYARSLPGAPDGEYVVIQFNTSFENKKSAVETVTPMLDKDGKWRVSGYYIK
ncbi:MAG: DUF4019 domain-containing protein [Desulfomonile tiedjei]|nr:DUF4019 domain-containing protein [Desulfomonile tiedjei]